MNLFNNKKCPRCEKKVPKEIAICPICMLNFQKFDSATNAQAKQAMQEGEIERVLMRKGCPCDISKWKLILITIFLGFIGAHYYYVGRNKMGIFFTCFFFVGLANAIVNQFTSLKGDFVEILYLMALIWGVVLVLWIVDICKVIFNHFKIPVSRD